KRRRSSAEVCSVERYVRFIVRHRRVVVVAILVVSALLATQLRHLRLEIRQRALVPQSHPYVQVHNRIADMFGGETTLIVGVIATHGDIFTPSILGKIARITHAAEQLPGVVADNVLSIAAERVKFIKGTADGMDVHPLMSGVPHDAAAIAQLKHEIFSDKLYKGTLVAADGSAAAIVIDFNGTLTDKAIVDEVEAVVAGERGAEAEVVLGGAPMIRASVGRYTAMMAVLFPIAVLVIGLVHYEAFRTLQAMFLPLLTALLSVVWALGIMGMLQQPMDTWSAVTPVVILAVAAGHAVQILKRYYEEYARLGNSELAVIRSVTTVAPVMLTAGFIAAAGFGSLVAFGVTSVRVFGLLLALGILSALIIEMTFTPACRAMLPAPRGREVMREKEGWILKAALERMADLVVGRPRAVLVTAVAVVAIFFAGALSLKVDNSFKGWFPEGSALRRSDALLNQHLAGTSTLTLLVEGDKEGDIEEPAVLQAMSDVETFLEKRPGIGAATSLVDYVKRMHRAMHDDDPAFYAVPETRRLVAQYLFLYSLSGPNDFVSMVDPAHRWSVIRAYAKTDDAQFGRDLFNDLSTFVARRFEGLPAHVHLAGGALGVQTAMNEVIVREKILNVMQVTAIIFVLSALVLRSLVGGLIVLTPLSVAVVVNLGIMGWSHTWLSLATAAVTSTAVSIGADFAIYLIFRIREELARGAALATAIRASLLTSGKAIFFVSSAVALGYLVLPLSGFGAWIYLGVLTAMMVAVSALATLTIIPALVITARPRMFGLARAESPPAGLRAVASDAFSSARG
ncbi:MAG TPA: MMPL family transporter, partial [Candidatus Acidoferrales bacterium]|nr:MMPL family transporter [Candidatus Acidoferrales bacterium]